MVARGVVETGVGVVVGDGGQTGGVWKQECTGMCLCALSIDL